MTAPPNKHGPHISDVSFNLPLNPQSHVSSIDFPYQKIKKINDFVVNFNVI